jgi:hypothetical protein
MFGDVQKVSADQKSSVLSVRNCQTCGAKGIENFDVVPGFKHAAQSNAKGRSDVYTTKTSL